MPKTMPGKKVIKILESFGWVVESVVGSHFQMVCPARPDLGKVTVPAHGHKDLPIGTFLSIRRQTGLDL